MVNINEYYEKLFDDITRDYGSTPQDMEAIASYCFAAAKRLHAQHQLLSSPDELDNAEGARLVEAEAADDMRAWVSKRPDLFGSEQRKRATDAGGGVDFSSFKDFAKTV